MGKKPKQQSSSIVAPEKTGESNPFIALAEDTDDEANCLPNSSGSTPVNNKQQRPSEDSDGNVDKPTSVKVSSKDTDLTKA